MNWRQIKGVLVVANFLKILFKQLGICYGNPPRSPRDEKCRICQQIVDFIYTKIEDDATAAEIEETLETVCDYMPFGSFKQEVRGSIPKN